MKSQWNPNEITMKSQWNHNKIAAVNDSLHTFQLLLRLHGRTWFGGGASDSGQNCPDAVDDKTWLGSNLVQTWSSTRPRPLPLQPPPPVPPVPLPPPVAQPLPPPPPSPASPPSMHCQRLVQQPAPGFHDGDALGQSQMTQIWSRFKLGSNLVQTRSRTRHTMWIHNEITMNSQWHHNEITMNSQWNHNEFTMQSQWNHNEIALTSQ